MPLLSTIEKPQELNAAVMVDILFGSIVDEAERIKKIDLMQRLLDGLRERGILQ